MAPETISAQTDAAPIEGSSANEAIVRRVFEEALGSGKLSVVDDLVASTHVCQVAGMPELASGPAGFKQFIGRLRGALFDLSVTVDGVIVSGADVVVHWTASGRHERPLLGVEPSGVIGDAGQEPGGRRASLTAITVAPFEGTEIQESRTEWMSLVFE